uniref:Uncharacterized protein n=1 Tax=Avena sativa TaxID=4498 RepID=A0ACD5W9G6_AVESA
MSSFALASLRSWPRYGAVPMTRCPDCPRTAPLKRLVTSTDKNSNIGREFVKCESKPEPGKELPKCGHFEWLDEYIERIGVEVASRELENPSMVEQLGSGNPISAGTTVDAEVKAELKKMNKQLRQIIELKK